MNTCQQVIILSAELNGLTETESSRRTHLLRDMLLENNIKFHPALGSYKGKTEVSFVTVPKNQAEVELVSDFGLNQAGNGGFGQESILHQDANGYSYLVYADRTSEKLGLLRQVSEDDAKALDNYTELKGKFYAII